MSKHMNAEQKAKWCVANNCALEDFSTAYKARSEMLAGFDAAHHDVPRKLLKKWKMERARKRHFTKKNAVAIAKGSAQPSPYGYSWERGHG